MSLILTLTPTQKFSGRSHYPHLRSDVWLAGTSLSMVEAMKREMEKPYSLFSCLFHSRSWVTPREARLPAPLALAPTQVFLYLFCLKIQADLARWPAWGSCGLSAQLRYNSLEGVGGGHGAICTIKDSKATCSTHPSTRLLAP